MIIGVDEVNFSPSLVGDCVVCAYKAVNLVSEVVDSKELTPKKRLKLFEQLQHTGYYAIALATVNDINELGIYRARNLAIISAVNHLQKRMQYKGIDHKLRPNKVVIDGYFSQKWLLIFTEEFKLKVECLINGDKLLYEISAASIVAKIFVDALFSGYGSFYPGYQMEINHGSPDPVMYEKIRRDGVTPFHRVKYAYRWWSKIFKTGDFNEGEKIQKNLFRSKGS